MGRQGSYHRYLICKPGNYHDTYYQLLELKFHTKQIQYFLATGSAAVTRLADQIGVMQNPCQEIFTSTCYYYHIHGRDSSLSTEVVLHTRAALGLILGVHMFFSREKLFRCSLDLLKAQLHSKLTIYKTADNSDYQANSFGKNS